MMKLSAYVIELPDNAYKVSIEGVYTGIVMTDIRSIE